MCWRKQENWELWDPNLWRHSVCYWSQPLLLLFLLSSDHGPVPLCRSGLFTHCSQVRLCLFSSSWIIFVHSVSIGGSVTMINITDPSQPFKWDNLQKLPKKFLPHCKRGLKKDSTTGNFQSVGEASLLPDNINLRASTEITETAEELGFPAKRVDILLVAAW